MLIRACGVTLNVTAIKSIVVSPNEQISYERVGLFKRIEKKTTTYDCKLFYKDIDNKDTSFTWLASPTREGAEIVERQLLDQIKETESERMTAALENALLK
jgi:hypothetical protein